LAAKNGVISSPAKVQCYAAAQEDYTMRDMTDVKRCYEKCFAGQAGQAVLDDLEARAFVHGTSFTPDPQRAAFNEGRRSLALHIRHMLDREAVAEALGFARPSRNAMDATGDRDACVEYAAAASTLLMHLSRYCEEIILWSSAEFGFMDIADECSTGSSIMPQKRNPDVAEVIRGKSGRVFGALVSLLTMQKGLPLGYDRDLQEDKAAVFDLRDTLAGVLPAFVALVEALKPKPAAMAAALESGFAEATDLAELLVAKGVPFRDGYAATKAAVAAATAKGAGLAALGDSDLAAVSDAFAKAGIKAADLADYLKPAACVARRCLVGGPAPVRVREEIARLRAFSAGAAADATNGAATA